jgi:hypothetical protein
MVHTRALSLSLPSSESPPFLRSTPSATASSAHAVAPRRHTSASTTIHRRTHHQPCGNGSPPPLAPKWSHWALVLHIKRALRADGKDIRDYVEADQIDELFRRDVEERTRRERERGRMARMRSGQELSDSDENARSSFWSVPARRD